MSFTVIEIDQTHEFVRGTLQRRLLEVRPGLFVGSVPARVRDELWIFIRETLGRSTSAIMIMPSPKSETGFMVRIHGPNQRTPIDVDGVWLVKYVKYGATIGPAV